MFIECRQVVDDSHSFNAHMGDLLDQIQDVLRVGAVLIRVVHDAAGLIGSDGVAFDNPVEGAFAIDDVLVGFSGDALDVMNWL